MKLILTILSAAILLGCSATARKPVSREQRKLATAALAGDSARIRGELTNRPPITMDTKFASACPYCGQVNVSQSCLASGGMTVTNGQAIPVPLPGGGTTNIIVMANGNLSTWSIMYTCSNCDMPYSDYRYQMAPKVRSIRLPLFGSDEEIGRP